MTRKVKSKIGLVLGGGGARGLAHIGVLKVLEQEGIKIDMVAGTSMGALIAACYALGLDLKALEKEATSFTKGKAFAKLIDIGASKKSIIKGKKIYRYICDLIGKAKFSDTKIPLNIIATDLANGEEVILSQGSIIQAIQASISVPGIFPPVKIGDKYLIDGGVVNPTPIDTMEKMGADIIIGVDLVINRKVSLDDPDIFTTLMQSYEIIRTQAVKLRLEKTRKNVIIIKPKLRGTIDSFKFYNIDKFIKSGEQAAMEKLPEIKQRLQSFK